MDERNLSLSSRGESTREKFHTGVVRFELDQIMKHFTDNINAIKDQFIVADDLISSDKKEAGETIWRSQVVFLASALDFYMHELTKYGLCQIFSGKWEHITKK